MSFILYALSAIYLVSIILDFICKLIFELVFFKYLEFKVLLNVIRLDLYICELGESALALYMRLLILINF